MVGCQTVQHFILPVGQPSPDSYWDYRDDTIVTGSCINNCRN